ncbi:MAG: selenocysteine-specific elongation factor [Solirubrobacteraceae bacterium]|nr:selenocysteine-specific elongation factor [Solirubrobacteraceae bacterium]
MIGRGDALALLPADRVVRVRSVQVHDESVSRAHCGQRVAVNLAGLSLRDVTRGDALADPELALGPTLIIDAALTLRDARHGQRVMVHHGTRSAPARLVELGASLWQLRLEAPLLAAASDRLVVRSVAPPDTLGGGTVLDPRARRHGRRAELMERLERMRRGEPDANGPAARTEPQPQPQSQHAASPPSPSPSPAALELAARLLAAGHEPPSRADLGAAAAELPALLDAGLAVRVGRDMYAHRAAVAAIADRVTAMIQTDGAVTLARLRDELDTSRRYAQALLEHLDAARVTRRLPDDRRVLRRVARPDVLGERTDPSG